jgi:hypothetical protein
VKDLEKGFKLSPLRSEAESINSFLFNESYCTLDQKTKDEVAEDAPLGRRPDADLQTKRTV